MITTTLNKIREHSPCEDGWKQLLATLGKRWGDDEPLAFSTIIASNGVADAVWCLRSICPEHDREVRLFAADCAESVLHHFEDKHPNDKRPRLAIEAARKFANGEITREQMRAAARAARAAARAAAGPAAGAAWAAARAAAGAARDVEAAAAAAAAAWAAARAAACVGSDAAGAERVEQAVPAKLLTERFS